MAHTAAEGWVDIQGLYCPWKPCGNLQSLLSAVLAVAKIHMEILDTCSCWLTLKGKEATFAVLSMTADAQLSEEDMEGFCDNPYPHPHPKQEATEESP